MKSRLGVVLTMAGAVEIAVGLLHFAMPSWYRRSPALAALPAAEDDFVILVTFAVGILLVAFGAVTLVFARRPHDYLGVLVPYLVIKTLLWAARLVLEIVYPVSLAMFGVDPFTTVVTPGVAIEVVLFAAATHRARRAALSSVSLRANRR